jgi:hypothetical protein
MTALLTVFEKKPAMCKFEDILLSDVNSYLATFGCSALDQNEICDFDRVYATAKRIHGDFLYLLWRVDDRDHKCSLALTESDLDLHVWLGTGDTPAIALAAALLKSLQTVSGAGRPL